MTDKWKDISLVTSAGELTVDDFKETIEWLDRHTSTPRLTYYEIWCTKCQLKGVYVCINQICPKCSRTIEEIYKEDYDG